MDIFDLLYPDGKFKETEYRFHEFAFIENLKLYQLLGINQKYIDLGELFTTSPEVIGFSITIVKQLKICYTHQG